MNNSTHIRKTPQKKHEMAFLRYSLLSVISLTAFSATGHGLESVGRIQKVIFLGMPVTHECHCNVPKSKPKDIREINKVELITSCIVLLYLPYHTYCIK